MPVRQARALTSCATVWAPTLPFLNHRTDIPEGGVAGTQMCQDTLPAPCIYSDVMEALRLTQECLFSTLEVELDTDV